MKRLPPIVRVLVIVIAVASLMCGLSYAYVGDDLAYEGTVWRYWGAVRYPRWMASHWLHNNGRAANMIAPLVLMSRWVAALLNAVVTAAFYLLTVRMALPRGRSVAAAATLLVAVIVFVFPWWDSMMLFDVSLNYVWVTAGLLWWLSMFFGGKRLTAGGRWLLWSLGFVVGAGHEGASVPLCVALWLWLLMRRGGEARKRLRQLDDARRTALWCFTAGTVLCILSPGIWMRLLRATTATVPDDTPLMLLLKSAPIVLVMAAAVALAAWRKPGVVKLLWGAPWGVYVMASLLSLPVIVGGGIVGRPGWAAQTLALIAIWQLAAGAGWRWPGRRVAGAVTAILAALIMGFLCMVSLWQWRLGRELHTLEREVLAHPGEPVYIRYTPLSERPAYLLQRVRGVPSPTETYNLAMLAQWRGDSIHTPVILPDTLRPYVEGYRAPVTLRASGAPALLTHRRLPQWPESHDCLAIPRAGRGDTLYYYILRQVPWGDRVRDFGE